MSEITNLLRSELNKSIHFSDSVFDDYSLKAYKLFKLRSSTPARHAVATALNANPGFDVATIVHAVGAAVASSMALPTLAPPFEDAWNRAWLAEGGQLLRRWIMSGRPGDLEAVSIRAAIVAEDLYTAIKEAENWCNLDAIKLGISPGDICEVHVGRGDFHGGHRSVMEVLSNQGRRWILRPNSGSLESFISRIISCCGLKNVRTTAPVLKAPDHSWYEFIDHEVRPEPATLKSMKDAGALMTFGWALRGNDFHRGNAILSAQGLTLIDSETFLQPLPVRWNSENERRWAESVLGVGVLPRKVSSGGSESLEVGLILDTPNVEAQTPFPRPTISTNMQGIIRTSWDHSAPIVEDGLHLPTEKGLKTKLAMSFLEGAEECRDTILQNKDKILSLLQQDATLDHQRSTRVILTPTYRYAQILRLLAHPLIISDLEASILASATICKTGDRQLWPAEALQMLTGDVPAFLCPYESSYLKSIREEPITDDMPGIANYAELTPKDATVARLLNDVMSQEKWIEQKQWALAAFRARDAILPVYPPDTYPKISTNLPGLDQIFRSIGKNVERTFGLDSLSVLVGEDFDRAWEPGTCGDELYGGMAGIIFALDLLQIIPSEMSDNCRSAALKWAEESWRPTENSRLGFWDGVGGLIYALVCLCSDKTIPDIVYEAVQRYSDAVTHRLDEYSSHYSTGSTSPEELPEMIKRSEVISGSAGRIRFWLELIALEDEQMTYMASQVVVRELDFLRTVIHSIGDVNKLETDARGYAHGLAGIIDTYVGASRLLQRDISKDITMIRSHLRAMLNWVNESQDFPLGWCHGFAGFTLMFSECALNEQFTEEAMTGLSIVLQNLTNINEEIGPSSCHGAAGIVEAIDVAAAHFNVRTLRDQYCEKILQPALTTQSLHKESGATSLMCGLAGITVTLKSNERPCGIVGAPWHKDK